MTFFTVTVFKILGWKSACWLQF